MSDSAAVAGATSSPEIKKAVRSDKHSELRELYGDVGGLSTETVAEIADAIRRRSFRERTRRRVRAASPTFPLPSSSSASSCSFPSALQMTTKAAAQSLSVAGSAGADVGSFPALNGKSAATSDLVPASAGEGNQLSHSTQDLRIPFSEKVELGPAGIAARLEGLTSVDDGALYGVDSQSSKQRGASTDPPVRMRASTESNALDLAHAAHSTPTISVQRTGTGFRGLMRRAADKINANLRANSKTEPSASSLPSHITRHADARTGARTSTSSTNSVRSDSQRDIYGYEVADYLLDEYARFMDTAILDLQRQMEAFDSLVAKYVDELTGIDEDVDSVLDRLDTPESTPSSSSRRSHVHAGVAKEISSACAAELEMLVVGGIPAKYRTLLWPTLCGMRAIIEMSEGVFERLLSDHEGEQTAATDQIERDIPRTFPGTINAFSRFSLQRVLVAYSWRDPAVGYCQSMNFITAGLLTFLSEEESFWMLCHIADKVLPDYFGSAVIGVLADAHILGELTHERFPKLHSHLRSVSFDMRLLASQWFMTLFSYVLPNECAFRVWDMTFVRGPVVLFEVALAILFLNEQSLLDTKDAPDVALLLHDFTESQFDLNPILEAVSCIKQVNSSDLNSMRKLRIRELVEAQKITGDV